MPAPHMLGIYPADSVQEVAQSLPIDPLGPGAAQLLAGDVEYRLHLIVQEARKFMIHGKRSTLLPEDIEHAMEALNVEPVLVPPRPLPQAAFQSISIPATSTSQAQQIYHVPDDEIDFATYLREPLPPGLAGSAGVKWKAHWLAVEGVQPAIPENPTPSSRAGPSRPRPITGTAAVRPSAKSHLSTELQLYFSRLTTSLVPLSPTSTLEPITGVNTGPSEASLPDTERHRLAALASIRSDAAVAGILVYLVRWVAESINKCLPGPTGNLVCLINVVEAILDNQSLFVEPYLHQFLAPLMSVLLTVPLGPYPYMASSSSDPSPFDTRLQASNALGKIVRLFGSQYPGLVPRLLSTLTKSLHAPPFPSPLGADRPPAGRYEGAVLGLAVLGPHAVKEVLWGEKGEKLSILDGLCGILYPGDGKKTKTGLIKATIRALSLITRSKPSDVQPAQLPFDTLVLEFGPNLARGFEKRPWLVNELMRLKTEGVSVDAGVDSNAQVVGGKANDGTGDAEMEG